MIKPRSASIDVIRGERVEVGLERSPSEAEEMAVVIDNIM
jgi:hypothetical protein